MTKKQTPKNKKTKQQPHKKPQLNILTIAGLCLIILAVFFTELNIYDKGVDLSAGEFGLFRVESATRYRYAKRVAEGKGIPDIDTRIQYPEGLNVRRHFTTFSQRTIGTFYRLFGFRTPFHKFVIYFMFLFSLLSAVALFLIAFDISKSQLWALLATALYVTNYAFSARRITGGFVEEDFALPFIFFSLYFILKALKSDRKIYPSIAGLLGAGALGAWHVSQFIYLIIVAILIFLYFLKPSLKDKIFSVLWPVLLIFTLAGTVIPVLRGGYFLLSFGQLLLYSFVIFHLMSRKIGLLRTKTVPAILVFAALFSVFFVSARPLTKKHSEDYGHVYTLMVNKIRHLGSKPALYEEVKKLPFDTKVLWVEAFASPSAEFIRKTFLIPFILIIPGLLFVSKNVFWKKNFDSRVFVLSSLFVLFIPLFLLVQRLYVFLIFFLGCTASFNDKLRGKKVAIVAVIFSAGIYFQAAGTIKNLKPFPRRIGIYKQDIIKWMNQNVPSESVVLSDIGFAPEIAHNTEFSTVIHNHYEAKDVRDKTKEFYLSLFEDEESLWNYTHKYDTNYLIYRFTYLLDNSIESIRYQTNKMNVFFNDVIYKLHFTEKKLNRFELLYQNNYYRIFRVLNDEERPRHRDINYSPFFSKKTLVSEDIITLIEGKETLGPVLDDKVIQNKMDELKSLHSLRKRAEQLAQIGNLSEAEDLYKQMLSIDPYFDNLYIHLSIFYKRTNQLEKAIYQLQQAIKKTQTARSYHYMISALEHLNNHDLAEKYRSEARSKFPDDERFK